MTRFLVDGPDTVAGSATIDAIMDHLGTQGHVAHRVDDQADLLQALRGADAVIAVMDGEAPATAGALLAYAATQHKPSLGLFRTGTTPNRVVRGLLTSTADGERVGDWLEAIPAFIETVRPFAGRLVRDLIPDLVKDAGHDVTFRALSNDEKPHFLKEKVLAEAAQLRDADTGNEKEEIADVLEALETLIRSRGYDRESLKQVKEAKRKRRGGFEKGWVVEETQTTQAAIPANGDGANVHVPHPTDAPEKPSPTAVADEAPPSFSL